MTDSMKFGPEWLRNLSADSTTNSAALASGGSVANSANNSIAASSSDCIIGSHNNSSSVVGNTVSHMPATRNMFPEFRYGREEMLSLFDKNSAMPELLPSYKNIFVERVQYPLALTPSTDEEIITPGPAVPITQRPAWLQRSPLGFSSSTRGTSGRGGSVDRGRMRGKSVYHPIYHRPTAMFEDDLRSVSLKSERGWSERNGAGDSLVAAGSNIVGLGTDWNGTPASSPRKEFSSHPRNMENWRRNRNEDGSGDASTTVGCGLPSTEGWRGPGATSFGSTHRWGRSTSWRDEDISTAVTDGGGGAVAIQRSYSTISTTVSERSGTYINNNLSKSSSQNSTNFSSGHPTANRSLNLLASGNVQSRNNQWGTGNSGVAGDGDDNLPEWAMENPLDGGGTFDASGAFHGSVDDEDSSTGEVNNKEYNKQPQRKKSTSSSESSVHYSNENPIGVEEISIAVSNSSLKGHNDTNVQNQTPVDSNATDNETQQEEANLPTHEVILQERTLEKTGSISVSIDLGANIASVAATSPANANSTYFNNNVSSHNFPLSDFSDRMKEVADDMVEKLIMDDDSVGMNDISSNLEPNAPSTATTTGIGVPNSFVSPAVASMLKQTAPQHPSSQNASVSPTLTLMGGGGGNHKTMPLFGSVISSGITHTAIHPHHIQHQLPVVAARANTPGLSHPINSVDSSDSWFYRDPQLKVQGPFNAVEMSEWYRAGYFNEDLYVRRVCDTRFRALGDLIKLCHGNMPFTHGHLIPTGLENMHLPNSTPMQVQIDEKVQDFALKLQQQHNEEREEIKNVTAAADSVKTAIKNLISSVDLIHMLTLHFQMLQEQYRRHKEMLILAELSKSERFQHLSPPEREAVVRQKVQRIVLPAYLIDLPALRYSLATLNPIAGNQLFEAILECSKKDHIFTQQQNQQSNVNTFIDSDDFILNVQPQQQPPFNTGGNAFSSVLVSGTENTSGGAKLVRGAEDLPGNELLNEFNLRMFLRSGNTAGSQQQAAQLSKPQDFMCANPNSNDFLSEQQLIHMWIPQQIDAANQPNSQQHQHIITQPPVASQSPQNQWTGGPLVGIPSSVIAGSQMQSSNGSTGQTKTMPASMWDVATLEQGQQQSQQQLQQMMNFDEPKTQILPYLAQLKTQQQPSQKQQPQEEVSDASDAMTPESQSEDHSPNLQQIDKAVISTSQSTITTTPCKQNLPRKDDQADKQISSNKRSTSKPQSMTAAVLKSKEENSSNAKKNEEERRKEIADEKKRQKEERKRQQVEEEKRRLQFVEDEKRRQMLEEKERQHQIQVIRRKAMLGAANSATTAPTAAIVVGSPNIAISASGPKPNKQQEQQQRVQSSVAPWSTQITTAAGKAGPCLAEIQKAERRERRADHQRQMEILEKQMRINAAAAEASDSMLKWNASPLPVKSFAEIQAEEVKRLASEQLETQRRKEHDQQQQSTLGSASSPLGVNTLGVASASNNMSTIWGGTKVWGSTSNTGFWEDPKFNATANSNVNNISTASAVASSFVVNNAGPVKASQATAVLPSQQKLPSATIGQQAGSKNLRKSQTVSIMQNSSAPYASSSTKITKSNNQQQLTNNDPSLKQGNKLHQQKLDSDRNNAKNPNYNNTVVSNNTSINKRDDFEREFNGWCTKSLNNMNTKVDVPTFVTFLQDLESPYEVKDYIRMYLGESKEYTEFAKQFLERRSRYKNLQRAQNAHNDDMCKPAPAITPSGNDNFDKGKPKKVKKNKMMKLDARILGFSVTAAEGRINVGDRDYADAP